VVDVVVAVRAGEGDDADLHSDLDPVFLDDRVREQALAHFFEALAGVALFFVLAERNLDEFSEAHVFDFGLAQGCQRAADCLALRVEDAAFEGYVDLRGLGHGPAFHSTAAPTSASSPPPA